MRRVLAAFALATGMLLPAAPAAAHGDKIALEVAGDGANGVTVLARYDDGHPVDDRVLRLVLTATGDGGRTGPVQLDPAAEGRGFYSSGAVLAPGRWTVTVTTPTQDATRVKATIDTRPPQTALPPAAAGPERAEGVPADDGRAWWLIGLSVAVAAVAGGLVYAARRRSTTTSGAG